MDGTVPKTNQPDHEPSITEQEKSATVVVVNSEKDDSSSMEEHREWRPGFWAQFPWSGIGALFGVLLCSAAAVIVVYQSNGKAKSEWIPHAAPNVLVNVFTSLASILITMAVGHGIAISWWRKAMKGTTVEDLHHSWSFSSSLMALVTGWKFFNVIALTALCTKFALIDSTLFQKALSTRTALGPPSHIQAPTFPLEQFPPTGVLNEFGNETAYMNFAMTFDANTWLVSDVSVNAFYLNGFYNCEGLCGLTYRSIGLQSSCTINNVSASRSQSEVQSGNPGDNVQLSINFEQRWPTPDKDYSWINMEWISWYSDSYASADTNPSCGGQLTNLTCELRPAIIDYPITMRNSSYTKRATRSKDSEFVSYLNKLNVSAGEIQPRTARDSPTDGLQLPDYSVIRTIDVPETQAAGGNTSLGGIVFALNSYYQSLSTVSYDNETTVDPLTGQTETAVKPVLDTKGIASALNQVQDLNDGCPTSYIYDYDTMLQGINTLMLIVSDDLFLRSNYSDLTYDPTADYYTNYWYNTARYVDAIQLKDTTYYISKVGFAWGAFASTVIIVLMILPSYYGFWHLGRKVTLGPFEIANAFNAPAFSHVHRGAGHVDGVIAAVGRERVQYGANDHEVHGTQYGFSRGANAV